MKKDSPLPDYYYNSFSQTDFNLLRQKGIKNLIIDVDNTLAFSHSNRMDRECEKTLRALLEQKDPFKACLVSNIIFGEKRRRRVKAMADSMGIPFVAADLFSRKPNAKPFLEGLQLMGAELSETAVVGDQLFTDILGGNRLGMTTVLVRPLGPDHWATALLGRRKREKALLEGIFPQTSKEAALDD